MIKPAIVAVGYNRPNLMKRLLKSIGDAHYEYDDIPLIISIDESDKSDEVDKVARDFVWKYGTKEIRRFSERQGLRKHIVYCGDYSEKYGSVIILEDDLMVADDFYSYTCNAHEYYSLNENICGVSLYSFARNQFTGDFFQAAPSEYDVYLGGMVVTWGQSWTAQQWNRFKKWYFDNMDRLPEKNDCIPDEISGWNRSWGKYFVSYMVEKELYYVCPYIARTTCFAELGEHSINSIPLTCVQVALMNGKCNYQFAPCEKLCKYDAFYERVLDDRTIVDGILGSQLCFDLNGMKHSLNGKRYLISNEKLPFKIIKTYAMVLKPIEMNVLKSIPGSDIYLYEVNGTEQIREYKKRKYQYKINYKRLKFEYIDMSLRKLAYYTYNEFVSRIKLKFKK